MNSKIICACVFKIVTENILGLCPMLEKLVKDNYPRKSTKFKSNREKRQTTN